MSDQKISSDTTLNQLSHNGDFLHSNAFLWGLGGLFAIGLIAAAWLITAARVEQRKNETKD
jgi:hypothetical protein